MSAGRASAAAAALLALALPALAAGAGGGAGEEAALLGERIYRDGLLSSGEPVQALVQGDIPVEGTMFSCTACHLRSGLGATEGTVLTLPTNGGRLFKPLRRGLEHRPETLGRLGKWFDSGDARPAYTDETLARAIRGGIDPAGRTFNPVMPRYALRDREMSYLIAHLRRLCDGTAPGVDARTITVATVLADDAPEEDRRAMLAALRAYVDSHNVQTRRPLKRATIDLAEEMDTSYRLLELVAWELHGDRAGWGAQLEALQRARPVFAVLGGISGGDWAPIHDFCERQRLPCLLPLAGQPVISRSDWYTLYVSRGLHGEGETALRFVRGETAPALVVVGRGAGAAEAAASGVIAEAAKLGLPTPLRVTPPGVGPPDASFWRELGQRHAGAAFFLALEPPDLVSAGALPPAAGPASRAVLFGGLLEGRLGEIPEALRPQTLLTWPWRLPGDGANTSFVVAGWAKNRGLAPAKPAIHAHVYLLGWLLTDVLMMMGPDFCPEYFLDVFDMQGDEVYASAVYPRLSFGPGQRYASKGCYVVGVGPGPAPQVTALSDWVVP